MADDIAMAGIWPGRELFYRRHDPGPDRVQVDVADQLQKILVLPADDRLVAVLEQMAGAAMSLVEIEGLRSQQALHELRNWRLVAADQKMEVIRDKGEGVDPDAGFSGKPSQPCQEPVPVGVVSIDVAPLDAPGNNVIQETRLVNPRLSEHAR